MRVWSFLAILCFLTGVFGCELIAQVDRSKIPEESSSGETTTTTGTAGEAGSAGMAGSGGSGGGIAGSGGTGAVAGSGGSAGMAGSGGGGTAGSAGSGGTGGVGGTGGSGGTGGQVAICGDGVTDGTEQCDDGNLVTTDACIACVSATCGDGFIQSGVEQCDDADAVNGNGCDNNCTFTACGNGILTDPEICDDGNTVNGDGCEKDCTSTLPLGTVLAEKHASVDVGFSQISAIIVNADGGKAITGWLTNSFDFGGGPLIANGDYDMFTARLDAKDDVVCQAHLSSVGDQQASRLVVDSKGNMIVAGNFWGQIDFGGGPVDSAGGADIFIAKYDPDCQLMWNVLVGNADDQNHVYIAVDPQDNIVLLTDFAGSMGIGNDILQSAGDLDGALAKFAPDGTYLSSASFGDANTQAVAGMAVDADGNIYMSGGFDGAINLGCPDTVDGPLGTYNAFLVKLDSTGGCVWGHSFGDTDNQLGARVVVDKAQNVTFIGYFAGSIDFGGGSFTSAKLPADWGVSMDLFVASFDKDGMHRWSHEIANLGGEGFIRSVAVSAIGNIGIGGYAQAGLDFGSGPLTSTGLKNAIIAEYDSDGKLIMGTAFGGGPADRASFEGVSFHDAKIFLGGRHTGDLTVPPFGALPKSNDAGDAILLTMQAAAGD